MHKQKEKTKTQQLRKSAHRPLIRITPVHINTDRAISGRLSLGTSNTLIATSTDYLSHDLVVRSEGKAALSGYRRRLGNQAKIQRI